MYKQPNVKQLLIPNSRTIMTKMCSARKYFATEDKLFFPESSYATNTLF